MERLYNPDLMPEAEIKATFVARQSLLDELISLIVHQPDGAGVQHVVLIAPRGMGKTTVLLMVRFAIKDRSLATQWQTVKFPEESYGVNDLADFWLETLTHLAAETNDPTLNERVESLQAQYPDNEDLQEAALALIKDWRRKHGKRLVLLVDNFDLILEQINDERDNAHLREVLMNDGTMMLIGGATTFFHEARAYEQPLYNFFKIYNLDELKFPEIQELLRQRAAVDDMPNFERTLNASPGRLRVLTYFTGGNPRLVLMLYQVVTQTDVIQVRSGLEKLLDEVTPYYKAKTESLPPQQRKILDHIARVSSMTHEGVTPTEIAAATRLLANQVSAQLKRLSELGYVRAVNLRGRSSYYVLSEPLYAIWHQMRFGRTARQRMQWLVEFLQVWYENVDISAESKNLDVRFHEHLTTGRLQEARNVLEYRRYLVEAMKDSSLRAYEMEGVIRGYLEFKEADFLKRELLPTIQLENLSPETLRALLEAGCVSEQQASHAQGSTPASLEAQRQAEIGAKVVLGLELTVEAIKSGRLDEALRQCDHVLSIRPDMPEAWFIRGFILETLDQYEEAIVSYDRALELRPDLDFAWWGRGSALNNLGRYEEAIVSYDHALEIDPNRSEVWYDRANSLADLGRYEEAIGGYSRALEIKPSLHEAWYNRGNALSELSRHEEAVVCYDRAVKIKPDKHEAWYNRGCALTDLGRYEEAITSYDHVLKLKPDDQDAWYNRGCTLAQLGRYEEAITSYDRALAIKPEDSGVWHNRCLAYLGKCLTSLSGGNLDLAKHDWNEALATAEQMEKEKWQEGTSVTLLEMAKIGHPELARQLIAESDLEEPLFPLARALDYILTGEEALLEKLSPEVRKIVDEIVKKLQATSGQVKPKQTKPRVRKSQTGPRRRVAKQLR